MLRRLYMVLKASPVKKGLGLVHSVESFIDRFVDHRLKDTKIEARIAELRQALHLAPKGPPQPPPDAEGGPRVAARSSTVASVGSEGTSVSSEFVSASVAPVRSEVASVALESVPASSEVPSVNSEVASVASEVAPVASKVAHVSSPRKSTKAGRVSSEAVPLPQVSGDADREGRAKPSKLDAKKQAKAVRRPSDPLTQLIEALEAHPKRSGLVKAGRAKDQLLRSLIPLYLAQQLSVPVSSGTTSRFWAKQGVKYAAPNAAKALREHEGYARRTSTGPRITAVGVKYVEAAVAEQSAH